MWPMNPWVMFRFFEVRLCGRTLPGVLSAISANNVLNPFPKFTWQRDCLQSNDTLDGTLPGSWGSSSSRSCCSFAPWAASTSSPMLAVSWVSWVARSRWWWRSSLTIKIWHTTRASQPTLFIALNSASYPIFSVNLTRKIGQKYDPVGAKFGIGLGSP